ncbi:MAG: alanine:cation symporter family protein [Lachnospiraceae bacterium]|nr:alanine:cation symporter family protein [Lachnospiraceae bacterium]
MLEILGNINDSINSFVWVTIGLVLLIGTGILTTVITKVFQVTHFGHWIKNTIGSVFHKEVSGHTKDKGSISQFQSLCTALAATIGTGNIAGVAAAIAFGSSGSIFWMWVAAFFGMMTNYSENVLGIFFRRRNAEGEWSGGAMYYLKDGLGRKKGLGKVGSVLAVLFAVFAILASFGIGNMGQVNKIVMNIKATFPIEAFNTTLFGEITVYNLILGLVLVILAALIIVGGLKRIANFAEKVIPFMVIFFLIGSLVIIFVNFENIGAAFGSIFKNAFTTEAAWGGAVGISVKTIVTWGFKRGVFSNEAGLGSSVMVHSNSNVIEPVRQGMWGIFEVFADTIIVCTITALVILTSGVIDIDTGLMQEGLSDATLASAAFSTVFGDWGSKFVAICMFLFAFTTVLGWSHYGAKSFEYLFGTKAVKGYKIFFTLMVVSGALMTSSIAWDISDTFNGLMMIPNLIGVIVLSNTVRKITKNYIDRRIKGLDIEPMLSAIDEIQTEQAAKIKEGQL